MRSTYVGLFALLLAGCSAVMPLHEHSASDHGDAIQGLYSQVDCHTQPGTMPFYVEVEGAKFFLMCISDEGPGLDINKLPRTDSTYAVFIFPGQEDMFGSMHVSVPHVSGGTVLMCFKYQAARRMDCFYRNDETGQIKVEKIDPQGEDL